MQGWDISGGDNVGVKLSGTNFCLDAGSSEYNAGNSERRADETKILCRCSFHTDPGNNIAAKIWTCLAVPQQRWWFSG